MKTQTASRRRSRQAALQVLYGLDVVRAKGSTESVDDALSSVATHFELPEGARAFAKELVCGVVDHRDAIDALIREHATHWRLERMAVVDRNVLRLGIYECCFGGLEPQIAIDEALELAHRFGDDPSPRFVNGVLDAVASAVLASR
jgi:N utilization substance protein B